jgi:hypothetical protein
MTTSAAEKLAGKAGEKEKEKEKTGIRRALGRGLESLLPGPRVVPRAPLAPALGQSSAAAGGQQVPFDSAAPNGAAPLRADSHSVRNDISKDQVGNEKGNGNGDALNGSLQAVAEDAVAIPAAASQSAVAAELRSTGQPGAAVPTYSDSLSAVPTQAPHDSISTRTHFRRGTYIKTTRCRSWRIRSRRRVWCSQLWCVRRRMKGATPWFSASAGSMRRS